MKVLNRMIRRLIPASLKNRLFMAFLLLILLPFLVLQIRNHIQIKHLYENRISEQNQYQIDQVKQAFERTKSDMLMSSLQLEKERAVLSALQETDNKSAGMPSIIAPAKLGEEDDVIDVFQRIKSQLQPAGDQLHYALSDMKGHLYLSFEANPKITYESFMNQSAVNDLLKGREPFVWVANTPGDIQNSEIDNSNVITLFALLKDSDNRPSGVLRISFEYQQWLKKNMNQFLIQNDYYILDDHGSVLYKSSPSGIIPAGIEQIVSRQQKSAQPSYEVDEATSSIINSSHIPSFNWYMVSQFPLEVFFGDIRAMNSQFFLTFVLFTFIFIVITFFILSAITRPLMVLKKNMSQIIEKNFRTFITTDKYKGEILEIADTFNNMAKDLNKMVDRLKMEERQKEAIRFQMLLQQMNPHFLLNTLNTLKWNVLSKGDQASAEICISLGKLLETSLNSEADLIHLGVELDLVEAYANIQNFRYDHRFEVRYEYEDKLRYILVPKLSLQPLVENAIQHGLANMKTGGVIVIRIYESGSKQLILEVEDNGCGLQKKADDPNRTRNRKGIGIKNLRERLELLFKNEAGLEMLNSDNGMLVRMNMPLLISPPYEQGEMTHVENTVR
ncbi:MAG: helicase Ski2 [Paenibacillus sp.]|jgi:two-component system sensor histidine kinase YesM|nr:helicase Ski2 [Paenibacillus sp.]